MTDIVQGTLSASLKLAVLTEAVLLHVTENWCIPIKYFQISKLREIT